MLLKTTNPPSDLLAADLISPVSFSILAVHSTLVHSLQLQSKQPSQPPPTKPSKFPGMARLNIDPSRLSPFQRHLLHFSTGPKHPPFLTFSSALHGSLSLGLNFPISVLLAIALKLMYAPFPSYFSPVNVDRIPASLHRAQLSHVKLDEKKRDYSRGDLLRLLSEERRIEQHQGVTKGFVKRQIDTGHILGFWTMAADARTHRVRREDVERFQDGRWENEVVERRGGRGDVLPFWRGGPLGVGAHSWAVGKITGVKVYEQGGKRE